MARIYVVRNQARRHHRRFVTVRSGAGGNACCLEGELRSGIRLLDQVSAGSLQVAHRREEELLDIGAGRPARFQLRHQLRERVNEGCLVRIWLLREIEHRRHGDSRARVLEDVSCLFHQCPVIDLREDIVMCEFAGIESALVG